MLDCTRLKRLSRDKHSSLLGAFVSYKRMKCCEYGSFRLNIFFIANHWSYSQHSIFFVTYECGKKLVLDYTWLERLSRDKLSSLVGAFVSYKKMNVVNIALLD